MSNVLHRNGLLLAALAFCAASGGCVERSISLVTAPKGAVAYLNDVEVGRTPCRTSFLWYGNYDVRLRLTRPARGPHGHLPRHYFLHTHRETKRPWFGYPGIDLFASLLPFTFKDHETWAFAIPRERTETNAQLVHQALRLRYLAHREALRYNHPKHKDRKDHKDHR